MEFHTKTTTYKKFHHSYRNLKRSSIEDKSINCQINGQGSVNKLEYDSYAKQLASGNIMLNSSHYDNERSL